MWRTRSLFTPRLASTAWRLSGPARWAAPTATKVMPGFASRFWTHRKLWETAYIGPTPIFDPDLPEDRQPILRGLALPDETLQKLYHDNAINFLAKIGVSFGGWG